MKLIDVSTEALARELRLRTTCCDCGTEWSRGWYSADGDRHHRSRCFDCEGQRRLQEQRDRHINVPLLVAAERGQ
jgi:hypothetical protein